MSSFLINFLHMSCVRRLCYESDLNKRLLSPKAKPRKIMCGVYTISTLDTQKQYRSKHGIQVALH